MQITIRRRTFQVATLAEASRIYCEARDASGAGTRTFKDAYVKDGDAVIARISYNGRVWSPEPWTPASVILFDNRVASELAA